MESENKTTISSNDCGNICRICLSTNQNNQCIFGVKRCDSINKDTIDLPEKLRLCSGVEVSFISMIFLFHNVVFLYF